MNINLTTLIGLLAGFCTTGSLLPQVIKIFRTGQTRDISLLMYILLGIGIALWLSYGIILHDVPIILANVTSLLLTACILVMKIKHG
jgi:MtN3 and saliva related transmembrane protein